MGRKLKVRLNTVRLPSGVLGVQAQTDFHGTRRAVGRNQEEALASLEAQIVVKAMEQELKERFPKTIELDLDEIVGDGPDAAPEDIGPPEDAPAP